MLAWEQFLSQIEHEFGPETTCRWLKTLKVLHFDAVNLYLEARDSFQVMWFDEHIRPKLSKLVNNNQKQIQVHLTLQEPVPTKPRKQKRIQTTQDTHFQIFFEELDPTCSLDEFLVNEENSVAFRLLDELAQTLVNSKVEAMSSFSPQTPKRPRDFLNPIYLYGPSGSGKTHLLMGLAQKLTRVGYKAVYARSELFTEHVVKAIRIGEMSHFRKTYRNVDLLLIDDIQVFGRKNATQEEFFHTFNALHTEGKRILLTANVAPQALEFIEPRLVSRFEWGIVLPLTAPEKKDIATIVAKKAKARNCPLSARCVEFLAETFTQNPKSCIKALDTLILRAHLNKATLTINNVQSLLADLIVEAQAKAISTTRIIDCIAEHFSIPREELLGKSQARECVVPRQLAMYLCRQMLKVPYMQIGDLFRRDHSTVMSACKQVEKQMNIPGNNFISAYNTLKHKLS